MADKGIPFDVPTRANLLQGQRLIDEQLREKAAKDAKLSPLDKAYAALEAARTFGSGILATVGSLPTRAIKGEDAAQEYINQRMYIPTTEKGMDYVGNVGNFLEQLETKYKLPPVMPEAVALQNVMGPAAKQATKQAAKAAKPVVGQALEDYMFKQGLAMPVVNPASNKPGIIVSNLIDEEPDIAKRLGAQARANRQAALEAEGRRKELAAQTQPSVGYRKTTEKNPDPLVGTRFVNEQATGLNPNEPFDISKFQGANALVLPWDSQSRNVKTTQVSGVDLPNQIFRKTHGGVPYSFDTGHVKKGIAGASGSEIAKRVKTRSDVATQESLGRGGTGEVLHFPITMGFRGEDYALPYSEFVFDMINNKLITGELTQKQADELSDMVRNFTPPISKYKGQKPFAEFKGFTNPEGLDQIYTGEGMNVPSGELRKAIADRLIWQKNSQEKLGFNAEDLMNATTYEPLRGVGKGVIGASVIRNTPTGMKLTPSPWKFPYDTDFSGEHLGRLNDLVDVEALFYRTMNPIKQELMQRENKIPYTKESLRNAAIGAIEKRNEAVSQPIDQQFLDDYANYVNELNKPHEYRSGGLVSDNPDVMMMEVEDQKFVGGGIAKAAKTAAKSAVATRELEKQAVLRAEAAAKSAAKQALMPQYNEAVKGMTQKQKPPSFEQWKAINYPEGTQGLQNAPQKQATNYPQEEALRLAQQRAEAVGQSADPRTRMLQQGYDDSWYHGTTGDINNFRTDLLGETTGAQSAKKGFFFARDPLNPPESMLKKSNDPAAGDLLQKMGIPEEEIAKLNTVSMEGHGPETASGYALIGGSREYKDAMRKAKAAEMRGDWNEYDKQMQIAEDSETTRMQYAQSLVAKYGDARDEMLEGIKNAWYGPENSERFKNMSQADYEAYDKKFKELMPYGWYNSYSNPQLESLKKELVNTVGEKSSEKILDKINKFQSVRNERALIEKTQEGGNVMPVALRYENPMVYDFEGRPYRDQSYSDLVDQALMSGNDALILKNTYDPGGGPSRLIDVGVVFEPDQIRSRFAAFDPLRKTAATAAAAGLAAPDLLAEENKASGGSVNLDAMYMAVNDAKFRRK